MVRERLVCAMVALRLQILEEPLLLKNLLVRLVDSDGLLHGRRQRIPLIDRPEHNAFLSCLLFAFEGNHHGALYPVHCDICNMFWGGSVSLGGIGLRK